MQQHGRGSVCAFVLVASFLKAFLCLAAAAGQSPSTGISFDSSKAAARQIAVLRQEWVQDLHGKQLDLAMALYTTDAVFFNPGGPRADGLPSIRSLFATVMNTYDSDIQLTSTGLAVSGNLAYDSGDYEETLTTRATRARNVVHGSYLMVLQRGKDQRWRIVQQMWTQNAPAKP